MASRAYPRQCDIERAVEAARKVGLVVNSIETKPDGTIRVSYAEEPKKAQDEWRETAAFYRNRRGA